jgi:hypothetical protein
MSAHGASQIKKKNEYVCKRNEQIEIQGGSNMTGTDCV